MAEVGARGGAVTAKPAADSGMRPHTLVFVAGLLMMVLVLFAWLGQYCPSCAVEEDWGTWGTWIAMLSAGAALAAIGLWWGAKKP